MLICLFFFFLCLTSAENIEYILALIEQPRFAFRDVRFSRCKVHVYEFKRGLSLSFTQVIPSLYPFILLTTLFKALSHDSRYARRLSLFAGFLSGYPLGAKVVAEQ